MWLVWVAVGTVCLLLCLAILYAYRLKIKREADEKQLKETVKTESLKQIVQRLFYEVFANNYNNVEILLDVLEKRNKELEAKYPDDKKQLDKEAENFNTKKVDDYNLRKRVLGELYKNRFGGEGYFNINSVGRTGSYLHMAARAGACECIKILVNHNCDINSVTFAGSTALHVAATNGKANSIKALIDAGINIDAQNHEGLTGLHAAASNGRDECVKLLLAAKADVNIPTRLGRTPLHFASYNGHKVTVKLLLEAGSDANAKSNNLNTPLHDAALHGSVSCVPLLLEHSAKMTLNEDDQYPIQIACEMGHCAFVVQLTHTNPSLYLSHLLDTLRKLDGYYYQKSTNQPLLSNSEGTAVMETDSSREKNRNVQKVLNVLATFPPYLDIFLRKLTSITIDCGLQLLYPDRKIKLRASGSANVVASPRLCARLIRRYTELVRSGRKAMMGADKKEADQMERVIQHSAEKMEILWNSLDSFLTELKQKKRKLKKEQKKQKENETNTDNQTITTNENQNGCSVLREDGQKENEIKTETEAEMKSKQPTTEGSIDKQEETKTETEEKKEKSKSKGKEKVEDDSDEFEDYEHSHPPNTEEKGEMEEIASRVCPLIDAFYLLCSREDTEESKQREEKKKKQQQRDEDMQLIYDVSAIQNVVPTSKNLIYDTGYKKCSRFISFMDKHCSIIRYIAKQNVLLLVGSLEFIIMESITSSPHWKFLEIVNLLGFERKEAWLRGRLLEDVSGNTQGTAIVVERGSVMLQSCGSLSSESPEKLKGHFTVTFVGEPGVGPGVRREWFRVVVEEMFNPDNALFKLSADGTTFQPNPQSYINPDHLHYFHFVGRVIGMAIQYECLLDVSFTRSFYKHILGIPISIDDLESLDPDFYKNLKWVSTNDIESMGLELTFCTDIDYFGQHKTVELIPGGTNIPVTQKNKGEYIRLVSEMKLTTSIGEQIKYFKKGFHEIIPITLISIFNEYELELLISGLPSIDIEDWQKNTQLLRWLHKL